MKQNWFQQQQQLQQQQNLRYMMGYWAQKKQEEAEEARRQAQNSWLAGVPKPKGLGAFPVGSRSFSGAAAASTPTAGAGYVAPQTHPVKAAFAFLFWLLLSLVAAMLAAILQPVAAVLVGLAGLVVAIRKTAKTYRGD
jgi:hypothetical protein